ncbi:Uncharacterised protein [Vibrio cholerae]|nr:Uncharacterised protein [Vibrio cholerae]
MSLQTRSIYPQSKQQKIPILMRKRELSKFLT